MTPDEIEKLLALESWPTERPSKDGFIIGQRSALRVAPIYFAAMNEPSARNQDLSALPILRQLLIFGGAFFPRTPEMDAASKTANSTVWEGSFSSGSHLSSGAIQAAFASCTGTRVQPVNSMLPPSSQSSDRFGVQAASFATHDAVISAEQYANAGLQIWEQVLDDILAFQRGENPHALPLWSMPQPDWFKKADARGRAIWAEQPEAWSFWTRWWDGVLSGEQINWDLQRDVAVIPNEQWKKGPAHIASLIAEIEARYWTLKTPQEVVGPLISSAHTDYTFDSYRQLMKMVPFEQDISRLRDPEILKRLLLDVEDFEVVLEALVQSALVSDRQSAKALKVHADQIRSELSRIADFGELRVGILIDLGETLQDFSGDEDVRLGLGPALPRALSRVVDRLLAMLRTYFSPAITRLQPLRDVTLSDGDDPRALIKQVMSNLERVKANDGSKVPPLEPDDLAALERVVDEVKRAGRNYESATHPEVKAELGDIFAQKTVQATFDKALYVYRAIQTIQTLVGAKDDNVADAVMRRVLLLHTVSDIVAWLPHLLAFL